jgi:hypothetical protein
MRFIRRYLSRPRTLKSIRPFGSVLRFSKKMADFKLKMLRPGNFFAIITSTE